jgi:hypothetical protein
MASATNTALREQIREWVANQPCTFDTAICLHLTKSYKYAHHAWDERGLSRSLRYLFNCTDRSLLGSAWQRAGYRIPRFITLEPSDACGWHAHAVLSASHAGVSVDQLVVQMKKIWEDKVHQHYANTKFGQRIFFAEPVYGEYIGYITKSLSLAEEFWSGSVDWENTWSPQPSK